MTEPSVTGNFKAMIERHGTIIVTLAFLRHYWKQIVGTAGVLLGCGIFVDKFNTLIENQKTATAAIINNQQATTQAITALTIRVGAVEKSELDRSILEKAIGEAAHITVTPNVPAVQMNAPQEARKGKVKPR